MSDPLKNHEFDWVSARLACSEAKEFKKLRGIVRRNCIRYRKSLPADSHTEVRFELDRNDEDRFFVEIVPAGVSNPAHFPRVEFELRDRGICVRTNKTADGLPMTLTVRFNDEGQCRFAINGKGEFLRWQVACRALQHLLFAPAG